MRTRAASKASRIYFRNFEVHCNFPSSSFFTATVERTIASAADVKSIGSIRDGSVPSTGDGTELRLPRASLLGRSRGPCPDRAARQRRGGRKFCRCQNLRQKKYQSKFCITRTRWRRPHPRGPRPQKRKRGSAPRWQLELHFRKKKRKATGTVVAQAAPAPATEQKKKKAKEQPSIRVACLHARGACSCFQLLGGCLAAGDWALRIDRRSLGTKREKESVCVCVCVRACACVRVCVWLCVHASATLHV